MTHLYLTPDLWIEAQRQLFTGAPGLNSLSTARDQGSVLVVRVPWRAPQLEVVPISLEYYELITLNYYICTD